MHKAHNNNNNNWKRCKDQISNIVPGIALLIDILPEVQPDQNLLHVAGHGGVIEIEGHVVL